MSRNFPTLEFKINYPSKKETEKLLTLFSKYFSLDNYLFKTFPFLKGKSMKEIANYFSKNKEQIYKKMKRKKKLYENAWKNINDIYFREVEKITKFKWPVKKYRCYLSPISPGNSGKKYVIVCYAFYNKNEAIETICAELLHIHILNYVRKYFNIDFYPKGKHKDERLFYFDEITNEFIMSIISKKLGIKPTPSWGENKDSKKLKQKLKVCWNSREDFKDYIKEGLKITRQFKL